MRTQAINYNNHYISRNFKSEIKSDLENTMLPEIVPAIQDKPVSVPVEFDEFQKVSTSTEPKNNKKRNIIIGSSVAGILLLALIFRKNLKVLFDRVRGKSISTSNPEPPTGPIPPAGPLGEGGGVETENKLKNKFEEILEQYRKIVKEQKDFPVEGTDVEKAAWREMDEQRRSLLKQLCDNNVSILDKKEFSTDPTKELKEKMNYLIDIRSESRANKATQLDVLEEYSKYGYRYWSNQETGECFIRDLYLASFPIEKLDVIENKEHYYKIAEKFLDIAERVAERDNSGMRDAIKITGIMEYYNEILDEKLALRFIKLLNKTSFQQVDQELVAYNTKHLEGSVKIKEELQKLKDTLKEFPYKDETLRD